MGLHAHPGALKNLGHGVARSTVAKVLQATGISPAPVHALVPGGRATPGAGRSLGRLSVGEKAGPDVGRRSDRPSTQGRPPRSLRAS